MLSARGRSRKTRPHLSKNSPFTAAVPMRVLTLVCRTRVVWYLTGRRSTDRGAAHVGVSGARASVGHSVLFRNYVRPRTKLDRLSFAQYSETWPQHRYSF